MDEHFSPSARRAVESAAEWGLRTSARQIEPVHLLLGVAEQEESRGAAILAAHGFDRTRFVAAVQPSDRPDGAAPGCMIPAVYSETARQIMSNVRARSVERGADNPAGTDVVLLESLLASPELCQRLAAAGVQVESLKIALERDLAAESHRLSAEFAELELADRSSEMDTWRILDAAANRAREGLRVLEDYVRFVCDDPFLTGELKAIRHQLKEATDRLPRAELLAARDTPGDVGTSLTTVSEWSRTNPLDVAAANFKRTQEAMRSLEEFGKLESRAMADTIKAARYRLYTIERAAFSAFESRSQFDRVVLYVLADTDRCTGGLEWTIREALAGGAQLIQLREKSVADRELIARARRVRRLTRQAQALFIMNDRPDIARLAEADGVHIGQEELSVKDARRIVGPGALVGVSTHSIEQARQAVLDGAHYIGVGPTFPSQTKSFDSFPGLELIRQVHAEIRLPAFAIGGIELDHLESVLAAGARRVAIGSAICASDDPRAAAAEFRRRLEQPR